MDARSEDAFPKRRGFSILSFSAGVVLTVLAMFLYSHRPGADLHAIRGQVSGADITRHGGTKVLIRNEAGSMSQTCNGVCDDFAFVQDSPDNVYTLEVRDAAGRCVLCDKGDYVTNGLETGWTVGGREKLAVSKVTTSAYDERK